MNFITRAVVEDAHLLADMSRTSFIESHGASASGAVINTYVQEKYTAEVLAQELNNSNNIYHIIYYNQQPAGYSKMIFNAAHPGIEQQHMTKLERLYLLREFYSFGLGQQLLDYNTALSKQNNQAGMWLFVWTGNERAVKFYAKAGFRIIGHHNFALTNDHANPNHQMLLLY